LRTINGHDAAVKSVAFDSNNMLASGSYDRTVKLWDKSTGDLLRTLRHGPLVEVDAFDTNNMLASCDSENYFYLWDKNTGDKLRTFSGHKDDVVSVAFDNTNMLASSYDRQTLE